MNEELFIQTINTKAKELGINPLLLISGIEGLYTFKDVALNAINFEFLDSLILSILALRIGDQFHIIAEQNLMSNNYETIQAAATELKILTADDILQSHNQYLQSFADVLKGKSILRQYHIKALEVAAIEIKKAQLAFSDSSIGTIILYICKNELPNLGLGVLFQK